MKRGEIWTVTGGQEYAGKPRPVVIIQDDAFDATASVTICALTTDPTEAPIFRLLVEPTEDNGLRAESRLMVDKLTTVPKAKIGSKVGRLADSDVLRLNRAVVVFLGLAGTAKLEKHPQGAPVSSSLNLRSWSRASSSYAWAFAREGRRPLK